MWYIFISLRSIFDVLSEMVYLLPASQYRTNIFETQEFCIIHIFKSSYLFCLVLNSIRSSFCGDGGNSLQFVLTCLVDV